MAKPIQRAAHRRERLGQMQLGDLLFSCVQFFLWCGPILFGLVGLLFCSFLPAFLFLILFKIFSFFKSTNFGGKSFLKVI
jgi:hypothetical protein